MMNAMEPGERLIRCLLGQSVDRIPFGIGLGWGPWGETLERWRAETIRPDLDPAAELGFDLSFAVPEVHPGLFPPFKPEILDQDDRFVVHRDAMGIVRRDRRDGHSMPEFLRHPVGTADDWAILKEERLAIETPGRIPQNWEAFRARIRSTGEAVQVGWFPYGVFGTVRDLMGVEALMVALYDEPDLITEVMEHLTTLWIALWDRVADEAPVGHLHIWEDMSGRDGPLISPIMIRRFMGPCYERLAAWAAARGVRIVSVDTDGDCALLVPIFMDLGVNMMFPFEVQAGNDIEGYRARYPTMGIIGGLDKRALALGQKEIDVEVARAERMIRHGRYIPAFDHLIPPDVPWANFAYAAERMAQVCGVRSA